MIGWAGRALSTAWPTTGNNSSARQRAMFRPIGEAEGNVGMVFDVPWPLVAACKARLLLPHAGASVQCVRCCH